MLITALLSGLALPLAACSSVEVPDGFPAEQVPLQSSSLNEAQRVGDAWNLTVDGKADQLEEALAKLEDAGFTVIGQSNTDVGATYSLSSSDYSVRLGVSADGKNLTYGVVARAASDEKPASDGEPDADETAANEEETQ